MASFLRNTFRSAMNKFDAHPYLGNCALGVSIGVAGDALAQKCFPEEAPINSSTSTHTTTTDTTTTVPFDFKRTISIGVYSAVVYPLLTRWYLWQEALCGATAGVGIVLAQKVALDEFVLAPFFNGGYLSYAALTSGESVTESLNANFWDVMFADWLVWPGVMFVCFLKVPVKFRPGYVGLVGVGWNMFLAYKAHAEIEEQKDEVAVEENDVTVIQPMFEIETPLEPALLPLQMIRRTTTNRRSRTVEHVIDERVQIVKNIAHCEGEE